MGEGVPKTEYIATIADQIKRKIRDLRGIRVVSLAIFGSTARREDSVDSDIDLLVVAEDIPEKRVRRIPDIVSIKRQLDLGVPLDILLVSKDECQLNFRNHNPLYLDIALDAQIVYDDTGFLGNLIRETHEYIDSNDIRRGDGSWSFPVGQRTVTNLSSITNKKWSLAWLADGKRDLLAASHLLEAALFEKTVYHCQQAVEKVIKAILATWGEFRKTHLVADILRGECRKRDLGEWRDRLMEIADIGDTTEPHVSLSRFPVLVDGDLWLPSEEYDADIAKEHLGKAEAVIKTGEDFIKWWFSGSFAK